MILHTTSENLVILKDKRLIYTLEALSELYFSIEGWTLQWHRREENLNLILFNLNCAFDGWQSMSLAFLFPLELEYQKLARLEDNRVSFHVIVLGTECIGRWLGLI